MVAALTESKDAKAYWRKLKQRLKEEGNETVTNCHGLKMKVADGKRRMTDVAKTGGQIACEARQRIENETGNPVITSQNAAGLNRVVTGMIEGVISAEKDKK